MAIATMRVAVICSVLMLALSPVAFGQIPAVSSPISVQVCDLLKNPVAFDRQPVRFRGRLELEFEGDTVDDRDCGLSLFHTGIWWTFSGDLLLTDPRNAQRIASLVLPVRKDDSFRDFEDHAHQHRSTLPNGSRCDSHRQCAYYDIVATFSGHFFATPNPRSRTGGSYGHRGCCHLFVIEQIEDVVTERTPVPLDGPPFSCTSLVWQSEFPVGKVAGLDDRLNRNRKFMVDQARSHGDELLAEQMNNDSLWRFLGATESLVWSSPNLLVTYTVKFPSPNQEGHHKPAAPMIPLLVDVTREDCTLNVP